MLLDLREKVRNSKPIKYTLITVICIPFALVGIGSYFAGGTAEPVAEVNGEPIDPIALERAYQQQRQQLARMFGGQLPEAFANESLLRQQALQQLITQEVMESEVVNQQFAVGDSTLGRAIRQLPNFQVDGQFDSEAYQMQLRASGMSVPAFEQSFRDDTALNQFRTGITDTSFLLPQEAERLSALSRQTRTVEAVRFDLDAAKESVDVSEEDIVAYFDENKDNYQFPQRAKIQYLELNSDSLAADIVIEDDQARAYYDDNRLSYVVPEQREVSHILLEEGDTDEQTAQINDIKARVEAGESFADLAREFSDDVGSADLGGSLGVIAEGAMVPAFEEAAFALSEVGELSEPVETEFGVHLIRLDAITPETGKPYEEVKEDIIATLQRNEADTAYYDLREKLVQLTFDDPGSLDMASDETGLEIKTSDWLDSETDSGAILSNPGLQQAIFSDSVLIDGNNSDVLEVGERHVLVARILEHEGPRPKTLDDVRDEVTDTLKAERAVEILTTQQDAAIESLASGATASSIADANELATAFEQLVLERTSSDFDRNVITQIFALPHPEAGTVTDTAALADGDLLALRLDAVNTPSSDADNQEEGAAVATAFEAGSDPRRGNTEFEVLLESLREKADVEIKSGV